MVNKIKLNQRNYNIKRKTKLNVEDTKHNQNAISANGQNERDIARTKLKYEKT